MKRWSVPVLLLGLAACRGPQTFSAPAPAGAVECAVREAEENGYRRITGQAETGVVRMGRFIPDRPGREPIGPDVRVGDRTDPRLREGDFEAQLRISHRRGRLRVAVIPDPDGATRGPGADDPVGDAQEILAECTTTLP